MFSSPVSVQVGSSPVVAAAIHNGHALRPEVEECTALSPDARFREEDPYTGGWTAIAETRIVGLRSRFEVDLNRPREKAVYATPADAWGLDVWRTPLPGHVIDESLNLYDRFYEDMYDLLASLVGSAGAVVVLDLHTYNHRRGGPDAPPADPFRNPEINVGTATMDRDRWGPVVDRFLRDLRRYNYLGRRLDVRENVKFYGGHFPEWIHETFPDSVCCLAVEVKKFFMDEWTGIADERQLEAIAGALQFTLPGIRAVLNREPVRA